MPDEYELSSLHCATLLNLISCDSTAWGFHEWLDWVLILGPHKIIDIDATNELGTDNFWHSLSYALVKIQLLLNNSLRTICTARAKWIALESASFSHALLIAGPTSSLQIRMVSRPSL